MRWSSAGKRPARQRMCLGRAVPIPTSADECATAHPLIWILADDFRHPSRATTQGPWPLGRACHSAHLRDSPRGTPDPGTSLLSDGAGHLPSRSGTCAIRGRSEQRLCDTIITPRSCSGAARPVHLSPATDVLRRRHYCKVLAQIRANGAGRQRGCVNPCSPAATRQQHLLFEVRADNVGPCLGDRMSGVIGSDQA
jgi:hypothetical protein